MKYTTLQLLILISCFTQDDGIRIEFCAWECYNSMLPFFWVAMEYVYLFLLQAVAVVLAFKTRKVKIKELNDSKSVACIIYVTTIVMSVLMIITFASDGYIIVTEALFSGGIMLATAVFLGLTFIPKVWILSSTFPPSFRTIPCTHTLMCNCFERYKSSSYKNVCWYVGLLLPWLMKPVMDVLVE